MLLFEPAFVFGGTGSKLVFQSEYRSKIQAFIMNITYVKEEIDRLEWKILYERYLFVLYCLPLPLLRVPD